MTAIVHPSPRETVARPTSRREPDPGAPTDPSRPCIAYVVHTLNAGGTEKLVVEMSRALLAEFDVRVVCLDEPGQWASGLRASGVPVHCVWRQPGFDAGLPGKLAALFRRWRASLVHAHQCTPWFYAALSRLAYPPPRLLLEEHGRFWPETDRPGRAFLQRHTIRHLTHRFVAVSLDVRERLARYEGLRREDIAVIYNGVVPDAPLSGAERAALRSELGFGPQDFVVGTVGRLDPIKNLPLLIDALASVIATGARGERPRVAGLLVGEGPERDALERQVRAAGLAGRVRFTGFREDARRLVHAMDLFVLSSYSEGTSMALLEAMGAGVPVAVTAVGGNPEVVTGGQTGWVVPSGDRAGLAAAISEAATQEIRRRQYAASARRRFEETYTFAGMMAAYRILYRDLLAS